jgi:hypothetical protein
VFSAIGFLIVTSFRTAWSTLRGAIPRGHASGAIFSNVS